jgi:hypothetical protein
MSRQCLPQAYGRCPAHDEAVTVLTEGRDEPEQGHPAQPGGADGRGGPPPPGGWQTARS